MTALKRTNGVPINNIHLGDGEKPILKEEEKPEELVYHRKISYLMIVAMIYFHFAAFYGVFLIFTSAKIYTSLFTFAMGSACLMSGHAGAHRLWSHRAYKARFPLRVLLMILHTSGYQRSLYHWARDHRCHHKYMDTDGDPHNTNRGMFFAHCGWLIVNKHPTLIKKGKNLDLSDLEQDSVVMFQKKYYYILMPIFCFIIPILTPIYFWGEDYYTAWYLSALRFVFTLNATWCINSLNHAIGMKSYDKNITPTDNLFMILLMAGEGYHNRHHAFPRDYKTSEFGGYFFNMTTGFLDLMAWLGLAYDLKTTPPEMIARRIARTGDGTHINHPHKSIEASDEEVYMKDFENEEEDKRIFEKSTEIEE